MIQKFDYDLLVIGGGSAGTTAAVNAVDFDAGKVAIIEKGLLGGTCTNIGCVPSKTLLHNADLIRSGWEAVKLGLYPSLPKPDYNPARERKNRMVKNMRDSGAHVIEKSGIEIIKGSARFKDSNSLQINEKTITAKNILIATGADSFIPPIKGLSKVPFLNSTSTLGLENLPKSILIVGGAYIGLEFAALLRSFDVDVTVIEAADRVAPNEDIDISRVLENSLSNQGIRIITSAKVLEVSGELVKFPLGPSKMAANLV